MWVSERAYDKKAFQFLCSLSPLVFCGGLAVSHCSTLYRDQPQRRASQWLEAGDVRKPVFKKKLFLLCAASDTLAGLKKRHCLACFGRGWSGGDVGS
ncbi:hypothetical protein BaRGS_00024379 [Batillaria attramentaria]|uniref:Secreted protein n=1 Tax=Batillaria attramentaria TaxID=370345 RepID=A0ABD0KB75_9CAEN